MIGINSNGWLGFGLVYVLLYPTYECQILDAAGAWIDISNTTDLYNEKCIPNYFCEHPDEIRWSVDEDSPKSLNNLIKQYDMTCDSKVTISLFATMYFIGYMLGSMIWPPLSDMRGRKKLFMAANLSHFITLGLITLLPGGLDHKNMIYIIYVTIL